MDTQCKKKVDNYLNNSENRPLIIDAQSKQEYDEFLSSYCGLNRFDIFDLMSISNELSPEYDLYEKLDSFNEITIITGVDTYFKLYGANAVQNAFHKIICKSYNTKLIFLSFQCVNYIRETDPKNKMNVMALGEINRLFLSPNFVLINKKMQINNLLIKHGIFEALKDFISLPGEKIYILTDYTSLDFPNSLICLDDCKTYYDLICLQDSIFHKIDKKAIKEEFVSRLLDDLAEKKFIDLISNIFSIRNIESEILTWNKKSEYNQWLLFLYLKTKPTGLENNFLKHAVDHADNVRDFITEIYKSILEYDCEKQNFNSAYEKWKELLKSISDETQVAHYVQRVEYKKEKALFYLTDNTDFEKKAIIRCLCKYGKLYQKEKLIDILKIVYRDLYDYLNDFNNNNDYIKRYFYEYKYQKALNFLDTDFKNAVDVEAKERNYKKYLMCRSEKLSELNIDKDTIVFFIDALGAEYVNFIIEKCREQGLAVKSSLVRSNLPSITSHNIEFKEFFKQKNIKVNDIKELDKLKHERMDEYDYDESDLPFYMINEFEIISNCVKAISKKIIAGNCKKAIIISDHGSTRLAVLNPDIIKEELESVGEHGGRVCKYIDGMEVPKNAIIESDYCILADYNSIKGGRIGKVEMHGGATLEEIAVPIIEITKNIDSIADINVLTPIIKVSYKKEAKLEFFVATNFDNVQIVLKGKSYDAIPKNADKKLFEVNMPDVKQTGQYEFEVWADGRYVAGKNYFKVEKESAVQKDLWEE